VTAFSSRTVELPPAAPLDRAAAPWADALVVVVAGEIEVECSGGARCRFRRGDVLTFARLPLHRVRNRGSEPARLLAVWRSAPVSPDAPRRHTENETNFE
jgi:quercetin dioxygenase-like cupin family protein